MGTQPFLYLTEYQNRRQLLQNITLKIVSNLTLQTYFNTS